MHDKEILEEGLRRLISRRRSKTLRELKEVAKLKGENYSLSDLIINDPTLYQLYTTIYEEGGISDLESVLHQSLDANDDMFKRKVLEKLDIDPNLLSEDEY